MRETTLAEKGVWKMCHTAVVHLDSPYSVAKTEVTILEDRIFPVLIGKWYRVGRAKKRTPVYPVRDPEWYREKAVVAVTTRSEQKAEEERKQAPVAGTSTSTKETSEMYTPEDLKTA